MKTVSLFAVLAIAVCLVGCEDPKLVTCQQEKDVLQGQLDTANTTIGEKDTQIKALKTENTEIQTKAMESIQVMMTKQAENDNKLKQKLKQKLAEKSQQVKKLTQKVAELEKQIAEHKCAVPVSVAEHGETIEAVETE